MERRQQIISSLKEVLYNAIQFQHIYLYLFWRSHFDLSCKMNFLMALIFLKKIFLYRLYADDTTFFLKQEKSVIE